MEALGATQHGDYGVLGWMTLQQPTLSSNNDSSSVSTDVLIEVAYSDINPVDLQRLQSNKPSGTPIINGNDTPFIPGFGGSGTVLEVGSQAPAHWKGKQVCFLSDPSRQGSYATHILVDYRCVALLPPGGVELREAASIPIAGLTAFECLAKVGFLAAEKRIQNGKMETVGLISTDGSSSDQKGTTTAASQKKTLLVIGGAGGVGSWIITLARAWHPNLTIVATASTAEQQEWCQSNLGANQVFKHEEIRDKLSGGREGSVDAIICLAEPTPVLFGACTEVIKPYGRICLVVAGKSIQSLDLSFLFFKCATVSLETVFSSIRTNFQHIVPSDELAVILQLLSKQTIRAPISPDLESGKMSERFQDALQENGVLCAQSRQSSGRCGKYVMKIQADEELIFLDLKTSSILPIPRQDCIKAKLLNLVKADEGGRMEWKEQSNSSTEREELIQKIVQRKELGIVKVAGKQCTDYEDGLDMQEAANVKNLWGVELKKRTKNAKGEELLFLDASSGALGEVSRKTCMNAGLLVLESDEQGNETIKGAVKELVERDKLVQIVRTTLRLNLEAT
jgi:NADPH2:quinone reductase